MSIKEAEQIMVDLILSLERGELMKEDIPDETRRLLKELL